MKSKVKESKEEKHKRANKMRDAADRIYMSLPIAKYPCSSMDSGDLYQLGVAIRLATLAHRLDP